MSTVVFRDEILMNIGIITVSLNIGGSFSKLVLLPNNTAIYVRITNTPGGVVVSERFQRKNGVGWKAWVPAQYWRVQ